METLPVWTGESIQLLSNYKSLQKYKGPTNTECFSHCCKYEGPLVDGKPNGNGMILYHTDKRVGNYKYYGELKDGQRHGKGSLVMTSKGDEVILEVI